MSAQDPARDAAALESLMAFWADSGVSQSYEDEAVDRLAEGRRRLEAPARPLPVHAAHVPMPAQPGRGDIGQAIEQARAIAAGAADLDQLAAAIAAFDGCALKTSGARQAVFARGNPAAPVMIIGEGPGAEEDERGEPFVGRAGKLLDKMIAAAGLTGEVFITNTVFWRPPGNRTPSPEEQAVCAPFLHRAIQLVGPKRLVLAGGASAKAVLQRSEGILTLRGRWFDWSPPDGGPAIPALATLHPAFLLRQPAAKKKAWADLVALKRAIAAD